MSTPEQAEREALDWALNYARTYWQHGDEVASQRALTILGRVVERSRNPRPATVREEAVEAGVMAWIRNAGWDVDNLTDSERDDLPHLRSDMRAFLTAALPHLSAQPDEAAIRADERTRVAQRIEESDMPYRGYFSTIARDLASGEPDE